MAVFAHGPNPSEVLVGRVWKTKNSTQNARRPALGGNLRLEDIEPRLQQFTKGKLLAEQIADQFQPDAGLAKRPDELKLRKVRVGVDAVVAFGPQAWGQKALVGIEADAPYRLPGNAGYFANRVELRFHGEVITASIRWRVNTCFDKSG
nr:hypothetical protein [Sinorhizobium sp. RAC02]